MMSRLFKVLLLIASIGHSHAWSSGLSYRSNTLLRSAQTSASPSCVLSKQRVAGGHYLHVQHASTCTNTDMVFGLFLPSSTINGVLYWLSALTCDESNFSTKGGSFEAAQRQGLAIVVPDTSPWGEQVPDNDEYDFGQGAGFILMPQRSHSRQITTCTRTLRQSSRHFSRMSLAWTDQRVLVDIVWEDTEHSLLHLRIRQNGQV
jgi:hypothetical protein